MSLVAETATLAHGYTMADVERMAWLAVRMAGKGLLDTEDRYETAWHGIVVALYESPEYPRRGELVQAGATAIRNEVDRTYHHHGIDRRNGGKTVSFGMYWSAKPTGVGPDGFTDRIIDQVALPQMLAALPVEEYHVITALAAFGDREEAKANLGLSENAFKRDLRSAREHAQAIWFSPEQPPIKPDPDEVCKNGHDRSEHGFKNKKGSWRCRPCDNAANRRWRARREMPEAS